MDVEFNQLIKLLDQLDRRRRKAQLLLWLPRGLLAGLLVAAMFAAAARYQPILFNQDVAMLAGLLAIAGLVISAIVILLQRQALMDKARFADRRYQLYARASTAVEIHFGDLRTVPDLKHSQLSDTIRAMKGLDIPGRQPLQLNRRDLVVLLITGVLLIAAVLLPNPLEEALAEQRALELALEEQAQELEAVAEEIRDDPSLTEEQREELLAPVESAVDELRNGDLSRERAVATLSEATAELRDLLESYDNRTLRQSLDVVGDALGENPLTQSLGQALREGQFAAASSSTNELADDLPNLSAEEIEELASSLSDMADSLETLDPELASEISQAAQAMEEEDTAGAQEALRDSAATLAQRAQEQAAAQRAASAAEQLEGSRGELAQAGGPDSTSDEGQGAGGTAPGQEVEGSLSTPGQDSLIEQGAGGPGLGGGPAENVFVPDFMDLADEEGIDVELPADCAGDPERCGQLLNQTPTMPGDESSLIPYDQVFGNYRDAAYQALESEHIPLSLRGYVRDYFSSLEP